MSERYDREEELRRRRAEEQRPLESDIDAQGREMDDPRGNEGHYGDRGTRITRASRHSSGTSDQTQGLYGSDTGSNVLGSAVAELIGTFILVFTGCAVAVAAILQRSTAGPAFYDSIVGPIVGAVLAAVLYDRFVSQVNATE